MPLEVARVNLPTLISIRVGVGVNGTVDKAEALNQLFARKRGETEVRLRLGETARFFRYSGCGPEGSPGQGILGGSGTNLRAGVDGDSGELDRHASSRHPMHPAPTNRGNAPVTNPTWERVQLARHPKRPHTLDYISRIFTGFSELHGDRFFGDDRGRHRRIRASSRHGR